MNKIVICILSLFILSHPSFTQSTKVSFGLESNLLFFRQKAPTVEVPFSNPHNPSLGLNVFSSLKYKLNQNFLLRFNPLIGFYRSNSNVTSDFQMNIYGFNFGPELQFNKLNIYIGYEYNRLNDLLGKLNGRITNWTNSRTTYQRDLSAIRIESGYILFNNFKSYLGVSYFLTDFHRHGALDFQGNLVGPVELTPMVIFFGVDYTLDFSKLKNGKR